MVRKLIIREDLAAVSFWRAVVCELVATCLFVFLGCSSITATTPNSSLSPSVIIRIALTFGLTLYLLVKVFGPISGCHVNPAVSLGFFVAGKLSLVRTAFYFISQIIGATFGSLVLFAALPDGNRKELGANHLSSDLALGQGVTYEAILTFVLVLVIMACVDSERGEHSAAEITNPLSIGVTLVVLHLAGIPLTGSSMNPARSFGPALMTQIYAGEFKWVDHWIYWIGPIIGGVVASIAYHYLISPTEKNVQGQLSSTRVEPATVEEGEKN